MTTQAEKSHQNLKTAFVVAHYDKDGRVAQHLFEAIKFISDRITKDIFFISTGISDAGISTLSPYCSVVSRPNIGYDFWSYKIGFDKARENENYDRIVFMNSSFITLNPALLFDKFLAQPINNNLIGLTRSLAIADHIQSYLFCFNGPELIKSTALLNWWNEMTPISDRNEVIRKYEIGMTQHIIKNNIAVDAIYTPTAFEKFVAICRVHAETPIPPNSANPIPPEAKTVTVDLQRALQLNPTHYMWDSLLNNYMIVKTDFLNKSIYANHILLSARTEKDQYSQLVNEALRLSQAIAA